MNFFNIPEISKRTIAGTFILKILTGTAALIIYSHYYKMFDAIAFFDNSKIIYDALWNNPSHFFKMFTGIDGNNTILNSYYSRMPSWNASFEDVLFNDARTIIRLNVVFRFLSFGNFYVHIVFICFLSLVGLTAIYKSVIKHFDNSPKILLLIIFLLPSVLFWSSNVLKEGLLFLGIGILVYVTDFGLEKKYNLLKTVLCLFSIIVILFTKMYILIALIPGLLLNILISLTSTKKIILKYFFILFLLGSAGYVLALINPNYNAFKIIADKRTKAISEAQGGCYLVSKDHFIYVDYNKIHDVLIFHPDSSYTIKNGSSYIQWKLDNMKDTTFIFNSSDTATYKHLYNATPANASLKLKKIEPTVIDIISNTPQAFLNTFIHPILWESNSFIQLLAGIENIALLLFIIIAIIFFNKQFQDTPMIFFCLSFVIILFVLIGLTTPVIGNIVRYKTPALPFLCIMLLLLQKKQWNFKQPEL